MYIDPVLIMPLLSLVAGIIILIAPRVLNYIVAAYLILVGFVGLLPFVDRWTAAN